MDPHKCLMGPTERRAYPNRPTPSTFIAPTTTQSLYQSAAQSHRQTHWFTFIFSAVYLCRLLHVPQLVSGGVPHYHPVASVYRCVNWFPIGWTYAHCHAYLRCWLTDLYGWSLLMHWSPYFFVWWTRLKLVLELD